MSAIPMLPEELLVKIFGHLNLADLQECGLVCRHWLTASQTQSLHRRTWITFRNDDEFHAGFARVAGGPLPNCCQKMALANLSLNGQLLDDVAPLLSALYLNDLTASSKSILRVLLHSPNLVELRLVNLRDILISGTFLESEAERVALSQTVARVRILDLSSNKFLSDVVFQRIVNCMPLVSDLSLRNCRVLKTTSGMGHEHTPNRSVLTFAVLLAVIKERATRLKRLDLTGTNLDGVCLQDIAECPGLVLDSMELGRNPLSQEGVLHLVKSQKSLRELDLDQCRRVFLDYPATSMQIFAEMEGIRHLTLKLLSFPKGFSACLAQLHHLRSLDCSALDCTSLQLREGLAMGKSQLSLTDLRLNSFMCDPENFQAILSLFPNLRRLEVDNCQEAMVDECLQTVIQTCSHLEDLLMSSCPRLSDIGFCGLNLGTISPSSASNLHPFKTTEGKIFLGSADEKEIVKDAAWKQMMASLSPVDQVLNTPTVDRLKRLEILRISNSKITDLTLRWAFNFCSLREIDLSHCVHISDMGFSLLGEKNLSLEEIDVSQTAITDVGLVGLVRPLRRLRKLNLSQCIGLSSNGILKLPQYSGQLHYLDVSLCPKVKTDTISQLRARLPSLREVKTRGLEILEYLQDFEETED